MYKRQILELDGQGCKKKQRGKQNKCRKGKQNNDHALDKMCIRDSMKQLAHTMAAKTAKYAGAIPCSCIEICFQFLNTAMIQCKTKRANYDKRILGSVLISRTNMY